MANPVAGKIQFVITGIDHKPRTDFSEIGQKLCLAVGQERPDKEPAAPAHRRQPVQPAATAEMMQEGLRLIAAMMAESNRRTSGLLPRSCDKKVCRAIRPASSSPTFSAAASAGTSTRSHSSGICNCAQRERTKSTSS